MNMCIAQNRAKPGIRIQYLERPVVPSGRSENEDQICADGYDRYMRPMLMFMICRWSICGVSERSHDSSTEPLMSTTA